MFVLIDNSLKHLKIVIFSCYCCISCVTFLRTQHLFALTQFFTLKVTLRRDPLHSLGFRPFWAFCNVFLALNDPPLERAWNGRDFDAKIDHDSTEIYGFLCDLLLLCSVGRISPWRGTRATKIFPNIRLHIVTSYFLLQCLRKYNNKMCYEKEINSL